MGHFKHWLGVGILLVFTAVFAALGRWQLARADMYRGIEELWLQADEARPLVWPLPLRDIDRLRYSRLELTGSYRAEVQVLLDNRTLNGVAGYEVLTPFRLTSGQLALVNRGWVEGAPDRQQLPDVGIADGAAVVRGRIDRLPRAAITLGEAPPPAAGPVVRLSYPDYADIEAVLGEAVLPLQLLLDAGEADGYARDWSPDLERDQRSLGYAVQWFALAALAIVLALGIVARARRQGAAA